MTQENTLISPFLSTVITLMFIFSTIYTLAYYYNQGSPKTLTVSGMEVNTHEYTQLSFIGLLDPVLSLLSWISPIAPVRALIFALSPSDLFLVLDLLILRPVSWITTMLAVNYILGKIPTISEL